MQKKKSIDFKLSDIAAVLICSAAIMVSLWLFFQNINKELVKNSEEQIAVITFKYRSAQRKFIDGMIWDKLRNSSPVYNGDTIRTASLSEAVVIFENGNTLNLHENTLTQVFMKKKDGEISILFDRGNFSITTIENAAPVVIKSSQGAISIGSASSLSVSLQNSIQKIQVLEGRADVIAADKTSVLFSGDVGEFSDKIGLFEQPSAVMIQPLQYYRVLNQGDSLTNIVFSWKASNMADDVKLLLDLYTDKRNVHKFASYDVTSYTSKDISLPNGVFYWKLYPVKGGSPSGLRYDSGQLLILDAPSPSVIAPKNELFSYENESSQIRFSWKGNEWVSLYQIEVADNSTMVNPIAVKTSQSESCYISGLTEGEWFWRVIPLYAIQKTDEVFSSEINSFSIGKKLSGSTTQPLQAENSIKANVDENNKTQTVSTSVVTGKRMAQLSGPELFLNNDFSAGDKFWDYWESQGIGAVIDFSSGAFVLSGGLRGMDAWNICLAKTALALSKYTVYELRFDAFSSNPSDTLQVTLESQKNDSTNAEEDYHHRSWADMALSAQPMTYSIELVSGEFDDLEGSIIFLLGDCTGTITIDNVSFKKKGSWKTESFEIISNGDFKYRAALWDYWQSENSSANMDFSSGAFVLSGGLRGIDEFNMCLGKLSLDLPQYSIYKLTFDASSTSASDVLKVGLQSISDYINDEGENFPYWSWAEFSLSTEPAVYTATLISSEFGDTEGSLIFPLGLCKGTITIDNVSLKKTGSWQLKIPEMVFNGDFELGNNYWNTWSGVTNKSGVGSFSDGKFTLTETQRGTENWVIQLSTNGYFTYKRGETYSVTFNAASTESEQITLNAGEDGFDVNGDGNIWSAWASKDYVLTSQMTAYTLVFTMSNTFEDPQGRLNFCLGNTKGIITIDNVSVKPVQ